MDVKLKLNKNFVACMNKLRNKYGENFERINGFHNENLNFTDFIDNFIDSDNVAMFQLMLMQIVVQKILIHFNQT